MNIESTIFELKKYWRDQGCLIAEPYDIEVGAGTMVPKSFFSTLGEKPWSVAYVQPSRRPADGRYGDNPYRFYIHHQFQVILKPPPKDVQDIYLESLKVIGIDYEKHDMRFIEDNWESPTLGAAGVGWEVWMDGQEVTQFTYFQQVGGIQLNPPSVELTYGIERLAMYSEKIENGFDLKWNDNVTYGQLRKKEEYELCKYAFELADIDSLMTMLEICEKESNRCIEQGLVAPAYEFALKCSHFFNILDARGAISVSERAVMIKRVRTLTSKCAKAYVEAQDA
ncbi:MAG TPA: glycine--tRNA ligase subunit alpha [Caldisericia bacterium]|nr:glycine--tRNA ligase subunit alpha [Caldisericia bacterium]HPF49148.1 glycine--tRNA ligase subunit alpha [Caldisericia bacterium]HPI82988.1 glycine--tRNA ligase subunit alpha [Caldisericia bacterium]HPQ92215.1 glycine--tRNA ligase subunit alpha [Caldisericia bacterium]HRV74687.1 glycine--tRNA ligase subunit alpha [Caldisericia bacterium]